MCSVARPPHLRPQYQARSAWHLTANSALHAALAGLSPAHTPSTAPYCPPLDSCPHPAPVSHPPLQMLQESLSPKHTHVPSPCPCHLLTARSAFNHHPLLPHLLPLRRWPPGCPQAPPLWLPIKPQASLREATAPRPLSSERFRGVEATSSQSRASPRRDFVP